jgi:intracellular sulfur oxidation DsrE/DsrF family protein
MILLRATLLGLFPWLLMGLASANSLKLEEVLARTEPPAGAVFEIKQASARIRQRFPGVPMALVTHGQEMFALQSNSKERNAAVHEQVQSLSRDQGIPVHVCETYAGWKGLGPEAFPSYVDVAPSGPSQINNYVALDYLRLVVPKASILRQIGK